MKKIIIAPASYGAFRDKLAKGTEVILSLALEIARQQKNSLVVWGSAGHVFGEVERSLKARELALVGVENIYVGYITSTIDEAEKARKVLGQVKEIILIIERLHVKSALLIWKKFFPEAIITTIAVGTDCLIERNHPVILLRSIWRWYLANALRYWILRLPFGLGFKVFKALSIRHPVSFK